MPIPHHGARAILTVIMKKFIVILLLIAVSVIILILLKTKNVEQTLSSSTSSSENVPLIWQADQTLKTKGSRFDYEVISEGLLYLNHMGSNSLIIYDPKAQSILSEISGIGSPRGVAVSAKHHQAYVTSPSSDSVIVVDTFTRKIVAEIPVGKDPDGIAVADPYDRLFVTNESGRSVSVIDITSLAVVKQIAMTSTVGNTKYDATNDLVYTAVHDGTLVVIDPTTLEILQTFTLTDCQTPHGFTFDAQARQALVTCQGNAVGVIISLVDGKELLRASVGRGPDVVDESPINQQVVVASSSGTASMFQLGSEVKKIGDQFIGTNAHTVAIDSVTNLVYFPLENTTLKVYAFRCILEGSGVEC